jgi:integrase
VRTAYTRLAPCAANLNWRDNGLVLRPIGTTVNTLNVANRHFKPLLKCAGLRDIRWHDIRHTCATLLLGRRYRFAGAIHQTGRRSA